MPLSRCWNCVQELWSRCRGQEVEVDFVVDEIELKEQKKKDSVSTGQTVITIVPEPSPMLKACEPEDWDAIEKP